MTKIPPIPVLSDLSEREQELVNATRRGRELVCSDFEVDDLGASDDPAHLVRAELLRELLLGHRGPLDPRGVRMRGARIIGQLDLDHISAKVGVQLTRCLVAEPVTAYDARLPWLDLSGSRLHTLHAARLHVDGHLLLRGLLMSGSDEHGAIRLAAAHIGGRLDLDNAEVINDAGPALDAGRFQTDGGVRLDSAHLSGASEDGAILLPGARIGGQLELNHAEVTSDAGPALDADGLVADSDIQFDSACLLGVGERGTIRLLGAHIGGQLDLDNAVVTNDSGPALSADRLHIDSSVRLDSARLSGVGERGTIRLLGAHIGGQLDLDNAVVINDSGPALYADALQADNAIRLHHAHLAGAGEGGTIRLPDARISGQLALDNAEVTNHTGTTIRLEDATVSRALFIQATLVCPAPTRGTSRCPHPARVALDGFAYGALARIEWWEWLHIIRCHTSRYQPQPYQQLAAVERAAGHDGNARQILITQQQDLYRRAKHALGGWWTRRFHWLWGALAGYGYRARRIALALLLALLVAGALGFWAGHLTTHPGHNAAERTNSLTNRTGQPCTTVELIGVGLDRGLPLSPTGIRTRCDINTGTTWGQAFTVAVWLVQAAIWGLATLALAGYTSLIRKAS